MSKFFLHNLMVLSIFFDLASVILDKTSAVHKIPSYVIIMNSVNIQRKA